MYKCLVQFDWDPKKNEQLKQERQISFEQVVFHLAQGDYWKVADHPNQNKYPGQRIYFVVIEDYVYLIPHTQEKDRIFLKTIIPSRKATRDYRQALEESS